MQTRQVLSCRCAPASNINVYNYKTNINTHNLYVYESFEFTYCYNDPRSKLPRLDRYGDGAARPVSAAMDVNYRSWTVATMAANFSGCSISEWFAVKYRGWTSRSGDVVIISR